MKSSAFCFWISNNNNSLKYQFSLYYHIFQFKTKSAIKPKSIKKFVISNFFCTIELSVVYNFEKILHTHVRKNAICKWPARSQRPTLLVLSAKFGFSIGFFFLITQNKTMETPYVTAKWHEFHEFQSWHFKINRSNFKTENNAEVVSVDPYLEALSFFFLSKQYDM